MFIKNLSTALITTLIFTTSVFAVNSKPQTIPAIKKWRGSKGTLSASSVYCNTLPSSLSQKQTEITAIATLLRHEITAMPNINYNDKAGKCISLQLDKKSNIPAQGYEMVISDSIAIKASTPEGVFYGTRTLLQMLAQSNKLPKGVIIDAPAYKVRSVLLDVGRNFIPFDELKDWVVALSYFKMN